MKASEEQIIQHNGCPNRHHCSKDETKCCYLTNNNKCLINEKEEK